MTRQYLIKREVKTVTVRRNGVKKLKPQRLLSKIHLGIKLIFMEERRRSIPVSLQMKGLPSQDLAWARGQSYLHLMHQKLISYSINREVSNSLLGVTKCSSKKAKTAELGKDPENFQNPNEGKEQGVFVDYSWANIGSFDDLDRIFSNDDQIFGNVSLGSADELWSSSKDVTNSLGKSFPTIVDSPAVGALRSISDHLEVKRKYEQQEKQSFTLSYRKLDGSTSHGLHNVEFPGDKSKSIIEEQTNAETVEKTSPIKSHMAAEKVMTPYEMANKILQIIGVPEAFGGICRRLRLLWECKG
ncbi:hypothetical protein PTKIN_Ptkin16aG0009400 [Pterospermum kingtungense]